MGSFGEIVEPISRTIWEDWDDLSQDLVKLQWSDSTEKPQTASSLTIFEGKYLSDYIKRQSNSLELINTIPSINMNLYKMDNLNKFICTVSDYNVVQSSKIIELLKDYLLVSKEVITVLTKPLSDYQTMTPAQDCVIRSVTTTKPVSNTEFAYPKLEQPNIISGVSAGVISWREHMDLNATAIVCYIEHPGDYQIDRITKLFEKFNFSQNIQSGSSTVFSSNLYI